MGTSGAYGGSGGRDWRTVRDAFDQWSPEDDADNESDRSGTAPDSASPGDDEAADLAAALATALRNEDNALRSVSGAITLASLLPRPSGGGTGGGGGGVRGSSRAVGRSGGGSTRSVARAAARGGIALGGAYALRASDRAGLAELGLDLDELRTLGPRAQCARILDKVLGDGGHPDEAALRAAAAEQLKAIIMQDVPPSEADALRGFIASFVFQMGLVELRSALAAGTLDAAQAAKKEGRMRRYIERRVAQLAVPIAGSFKVSDFGVHANRLAREAIDLLRAK